jgi:hypothetical protein
MIILLIKMLAVAVSIGAILCISTSAPGRAAASVRRRSRGAGTS